eukprot:g52427.t1
MAEGAQSSSLSSVASASTAEESCRNIDTKSHAINEAFANRNAQGEGNNAGEVLFLQNANYPTDLKVTVGRDVPRLKALADLHGLDQALMSLSAGPSFSAGTCVKVEFAHPSSTALFRPGHGDDTEGSRKWCFSEEGAKIVEGTHDTDRTMWLPSVTLNGTKVGVRATSKAGSVSVMLEDAETTVSLAKVLRIIKRVFGKRFYVRFVFCYKNKNNVVRILRSTPDWIHGVVPQPFQELLNHDPKAVFPFTTKDKSLEEELVKSIARCLQWSDRQAGKLNSGLQILSRSVSQVKIELVALQAKLEKAEAACREAADKLRAAEAGNNEANKIADDSLLLVDQERKAKLSAQAEVANVKSQLSKIESDQSKLRGQEQKQVVALKAKIEQLTSDYDKMVEQSNKFERSNQRNKTTNAELRKELTQLKKEVAQLKNAPGPDQVEALESKLHDAEGTIKELTDALEFSKHTSGEYRKALKNAKSELECMKTQRDILQLRPASSYGMHVHRPPSASSESSAPHSCHQKRSRHQHSKSHSHSSKKEREEHCCSGSDSDSGKIDSPCRKHRRK